MTRADPEAMDALYEGREIEVNTPTGKTFWANLQDNGLLVISTKSKLFAQTGEEAEDRLENALKAVGTEWSLRQKSTA